MAQLKSTFKDMFIFVMKRIGLILSAILILILMGAGIGLAILLRVAGLDFTTIVVPGLIVEFIGCAIAYSFTSNFFPKIRRDFDGAPSKKSSRSYRETKDVQEPAPSDAELPERKIKK